MDDSGNRVVMGTLLVLTGVILGAGVALLVAPQAGEETRKDVIKLVRGRRGAGRRGPRGNSRKASPGWSTP